MKVRLLLLALTIGLLVLLAAGCNPQPLPVEPTPIPTLIPATLPPEPTAVPQAAPTTAEPGAEVFNTNCSACHNLDDTQKVGPGLAGLFDREVLPNGNPVTEDNLEQWIQNGGGAMPGILLSDDQLEVLTAFLKETTQGEATEPAQPTSPPEPTQSATDLGTEGFNANCSACHEGIEDIRDPNSGMFLAINALGGCTACHGGDSRATTEEDAHSGDFYPDPGSVWIADKTCGQGACHPGYPYALERALMNTEAGKIQGNTWAWGIPDRYAVKWGNYAVEDTDGATPAMGTDTYKEYMKPLMAEFPDVFPTALERLPSPTVEEILADPKLAGFTYQQHDCQRCHVGVKGRSKRGDWRGMGCSACHIPYSNEGLHEGGDPTVPTDEPGHMLKHTIMGTGETGQGLPVETCNSCHNRGKRIGPTFQGFMEFPYGTPFDAGGSKQPPLHTKQYLFIKTDLHYEMESRDENPTGRLLCQDCHTSLDMHGDGSIFGTTLAQVEIECADCHGTPDKYPWELPPGFGEEFAKELPDAPRGVATELETYQALGTVYDMEDGYLLTTRGNPFGNVVRRGNKVFVHTVNGQEFKVPVLKNLAEIGGWKTKDAAVAMEKVAPHLDKLECYACHADWAPQCYGCHVKVSYGEGEEGTDWVATGNAKNPDGTHGTVTSPGKVSEGRSYLRWEEPILGINGEGRVSPLIPGCQVVYTVLGPDGEALAHNQIGRTPANTEGAGPKGQKGLDMAPVQPHSSGRRARSCESCHSNPKALGYGIEDGRFQTRYAEPLYAAMDDAEGNPLAENVQVQIQSIPDLDHDWSKIVTREGQQLMTVGSHWPLSRSLNNDERTKMERIGVCMGCHQNMADTAFWNDGVIAKYGKVFSNDEHINTMNQLIIDAVAAEGSVKLPTSPPELTQSATNLGAEVFNANCSACHNLDDIQKVGPGLAGLFDRNTLPNGNPVNDDNLKEWIRNGGGVMPGMRLKDDDMEVLITFLKDATQ